MTLYSPIFYSQRAWIVGSLTEQRVPGMHPEREFVVAGGLLSYGVDFPTLWKRSASYVDRILKGTRAAELPIEQPSRILLSINTGTARRLGLDIPFSVMALADEVIE
jgi:putative ABC transport system substrate-binding protein